MLGRDPGGRLQRNRAALAAALVVSCTAAWASRAGTPAVSESAVWVPKALTFTYRGFTTKYTCDALRTKMKAYLLELGARPDLEIRTWGCTQPVAPDVFPGVSVEMNVLQPAPAGAAQVSATWKRVDLLVNRNPLDAAADCELISQIRLNVLPLFTTRNVDYEATCSRGQMHPGATRLTADVLVTDASAATAFR